MALTLALVLAFILTHVQTPPSCPLSRHCDLAYLQLFKIICDDLMSGLMIHLAPPEQLFVPIIPFFTTQRSHPSAILADDLTPLFIWPQRSDLDLEFDLLDGLEGRLTGGQHGAVVGDAWKRARWWGRGGWRRGRNWIWKKMEKENNQFFYGRAGHPDIQRDTDIPTYPAIMSHILSAWTKIITG